MEEQRIAEKQQESAPATDNRPDEEVADKTNQSTPAAKPVASGKPSKNARVAIVQPESETGDNTTTGKASMSKEGATSDHSVKRPASPRKQRRSGDDMTSAFIIPDITMRQNETAVEENSTKVPEPTQQALNNFPGHDGKNCTICKYFLPGTNCHHSRKDHHKLNDDDLKNPSRLIPVSERSSYNNNEDHTIRPSEPPEMALSGIQRNLESERVHLAHELELKVTEYNRLDPSMAKRERKKLSEKCNLIFEELEYKADQIYALYDVAEGMKQKSGLRR